MRNKLFTLLVVTIISLGLFVGCTISKTGELDVLVQNTGSEPLIGAKVVSNTQPKRQLKVTGITNNEGRVIFKDIKVGDYDFYVSYYGQKEFTATVKADKITSIIVVMDSP
jgi:hypothetical protein